MARGQRPPPGEGQSIRTCEKCGNSVREMANGNLRPHSKKVGKEWVSCSGK